MLRIKGAMCTDKDIIHIVCFVESGSYFDGHQSHLFRSTVTESTVTWGSDPYALIPQTTVFLIFIRRGIPDFKPPDPINHLFSLSGSQISGNNFTYRSVYKYKKSCPED